MRPSPTDIDAYRLDSRVARGRSGEVWRAIGNDGVAVAVKVHERADDGRREAERLAAVDHPGVVPLLDCGPTDDGRFWLALPWIDGETLAHRLATGAPLPLDRVRALVDELAAALDALHRAGLVHGDLSPSNVLIGGDDRVTLIDLSASLPGDAEAIDRTTGLEVATTPRYAAPEVAGGHPAGPAADVYALTLLAYEAATGAFPYPEVATPIAMLGHHASTPPVAPSEHRPDLPPGVDAALLAGLAKDPARRPATAVDLADVLGLDEVDGSNERGPGAVVLLGVVAAVLGLVAVVGWRQLGSVDGTDDQHDGLGSTAVASSDDPAATGDSAADPSDQGSTGRDPAAEGGVDPATGVLAVETASPWPAGRAAGLSCNLMATTDAEAGALPDHFYAGDPSNTAALAPGAGVDGTTALRVGADDRFGLYGEIIPIGSHRQFVFTAWLRADGVAGAEGDDGVDGGGGDGGRRGFVYVDYLDADFVQLTAERDRLDLDRPVAAVDGGRVLLVSDAPEGSVYAVPTFFKDGSAGSLLVDEVVFGPVTTCPDLAS